MDWGAVVLFVALSPGVLFQMLRNQRVVEFGSLKTNNIAIIVHAVIDFALITIFVVAIGVHIYTG
ncbi:hypothetical protein Cni_G26388 [Canna indica]|uniref:Uncharacterized protein n=1 Tax=Canna indica TaxID=4628 RepID=A0AAQ3QR99_9LILI|nr:hypothetical protein Cni_G26388 [Canna indica]